MTRSLQAGMSGPSAPPVPGHRGGCRRGGATCCSPPRGGRGGRARHRPGPAYPAVTGLASGDPELIRAGYLVMGLLAETVLVPLALAPLTTGILLGLGTMRFAATLLGPHQAGADHRDGHRGGLRAAAGAQSGRSPGVAGAARRAIDGRDRPARSRGDHGTRRALLVPVATVALALFKPWGQTRFRRR